MSGRLVEPTNPRQQAITALLALSVLVLAITVSHGGARSDSGQPRGIPSVPSVRATAHSADTGQNGSPAVDSSIKNSYSKLPLAFVPNAGQTDRDVRYYAQGPG